MAMLLKRENCCRERSLPGRKHSVDMFPTTDVLIDMFPHTADIHSGVSGHVEIDALLQRLSNV